MAVCNGEITTQPSVCGCNTNNCSWAWTGFPVVGILVCVWDAVGVHTGACAFSPPRSAPAALVPGAPSHVCRSIILSGLPGSYYFTTVIIYSSTEPSAWEWALTLMSLTAGQQPHSGHINHQSRWRGTESLERGDHVADRGPVSTSIFHAGICYWAFLELDKPKRLPGWAGKLR